MRRDRRDGRDGTVGTVTGRTIPPTPQKAGRDGIPPFRGIPTIPSEVHPAGRSRTIPMEESKQPSGDPKMTVKDPRKSFLLLRHGEACTFHLDQYPWECDCGAKSNKS